MGTTITELLSEAHLLMPASAPSSFFGCFLEEFFSETQGIERGPELLRPGSYAKFYPTLWQKLAD